jgi:hypothetical protein
LKFFQVWEEAKKLRRSTQPSDRLERRDLDRWFHVQEELRRSGIWRIGKSAFPWTRDIGEITGENPDIIRAIHSGGTGVGDRDESRVLQIGKSEFLRTRETRLRKSRNPESKSGPSIWKDAWQRSVPSGKSRQEVIPSVFEGVLYIEIGDIGDPE